MKKVLIFGGTGFIGLSLAKHLSKMGLEAILIGRNKPREKLEHEFLQWDAQTVGPWVQALNNALAIVNLAGKSVDCIKTPENCDIILRSRVDATNTIGKALKQIENPPKVWIQMSTAHIYGDPPKKICTEGDAFGLGLAPTVGKAWEQAFNKSILEPMRGVILRTSFVIGKNGGALKSLKRIVKLGLGGTVGSGTQGMSWIHENDMNEIIYQSIKDEKYHGAYIASSPNPKSNKEFMKNLRKRMKIFIGIPAPAFITRLGAKYIFRTDPELALYGRYVMPQRLIDQGFQFQFPTLDATLKHLL